MTKLAALLLAAGALCGCEPMLAVEGPPIVAPRGASDVLLLPASWSRGVASRPLLPGVTYRVTVEGTVSLWHAMHWSSVCTGAPWPAPQLRAAGESGPVGVDAEWVWAWPTSSSLCQDGVPTRPAPMARRGLLFDASGGGAPQHLPPPFEAAMTPEHVYSYVITGTGAPAVFFIDDDPIHDNYGAFRIVLFPVGPAAPSGPVAVPLPPAVGAR